MVNWKNQQGFTLIEMMVALTLFAILMAMVLSFYLQSNIMAHKGGKEIEIQEGLRYGLDKMVRELRNSTRLTAISVNSITFKQNDDTNVTYAWDSIDEELTREIDSGGGAQPVGSNITGLEFEYYNSAGTKIIVLSNTAPENIERVKITLTGDDTRAAGSPLAINPSTLSTSVTIRIKNN